MRTRHGGWLWLMVALTASGCDDSSLPPLIDKDSSPARRDDAGLVELRGDAGQTSTDGAGERCRPIMAERQPARAKLVEEQAADPGAAAGESLPYSANQLYQDFNGLCGSCHGATPLAGNKLSVTNELAFKNLLTIDSVERMTTDDPDQVMPYGGKLLEERGAMETVVLFEKRLEAWIAADKPDSFGDPVASSSEAAPLSFVLSRELGQALTNMGSCVPAAKIVATEKAKMKALDKQFAAAGGFEDLPRKLSQTDLFTLDNQALAEHGVFSYAPTYPLWSDDAHKMRYVRVPSGESIAFSSTTQRFEIPDNTRFYKTFSKEVTDLDGNVGYRKIETRLIVVRRGGEKDDGLPQINALYGSYAWNESETEAELVTDTYRDGSPFRDRVIVYTKNEQVEQPLVEQNDPDLESQLFTKGARRHYAIPGGDRCVQCHMGGADQSFVLGFNPLQIMRRPMGEGGVLEPAEPDELNQLQRFIDYGLITGIDSLQKVVPLEKSQGERSPRSDYELMAQGYMLGNCAHCHNPEGYPTRSAPALKGVLDFMPSADGGGIFQFPLEKTSPRIQRHADRVTGVVEMPYITPSLYDLGGSVGSVPYSYTNSPELPQLLFSPWRSLIFRNVETPFTYSDGDAIYPHMPMNTAGYDCRAPRIMAEWMVSIPALPKESTAAAVDVSVQPLREVQPGEPGYADAQLAATVRLQDYRNGNRARYCPDTSDILDPKESVLDPTLGKYGIPSHTHWVETDLTPDPRWLPRNPAWHDVLVDNNFDSVTAGLGSAEAEQKLDFQSKFVPLLDSVGFSPELASFALTEVPFGLWKDNESCNFPDVPDVASVSADLSWSWLETNGNRNDPSRHVYMQSPGAAIFSMVCINCHGPGLDAKGRQADTVALLSGGKVRVANFRAGLFGPLDDTRANREGQFDVAGSNASVDDWAARYMAWMALGGTTAHIPAAVLNVVGANPVLGQPVRRGVSASPNMLELAKVTCGLLLPSPSLQPTSTGGLYLDSATRTVRLPSPQFTDVNGDSDLWKRVCSFQNPAPVRVLTMDLPEDPKSTLDDLRVTSLARRKTAAGLSVFPSEAPVLDETSAIVSGLTDANRFPICLGRYPTEAQNKRVEQLVAAEAAKSGRPPLPFCPAQVVSASGTQLRPFGVEDEFAWVYRGAINAGFSVYAFIDAVTSGNPDVRVKPDYDQCEKLEQSTP